VTEELRLHWALHEIDEQAVAREHLLAKHPEQRRAHEARVAAARAAVHAIDQRMAESLLRRRVLDGEIATHDAQVRRFEQQLMSVTTQHQLEAMQHEIATVRARRDVLETEALERLDAEERDAAVRPEKAHALERAEAEAKAAFGRLDAETATIQHEMASLDARRAEVEAQLSPAARTRYEKLRAGRGGRAVAAIQNHACGGCFRGLPPAGLQEARRREKLLVCDGCGRLMLLPPDPAAE
jgi:predicted  nucleic acid-binding Zn-ribbon protein